MPKRKSPAGSPEPDSKRPRTAGKKAKKSTPEVAFEQFVPSPEFATKYKLDLEGADVFYKEDFVPPETANAWYDELNDLKTWYRPTLKVYGRDVTQSRLIAGKFTQSGCPPPYSSAVPAYATTPSLTVKYSGHPVTLHTTYPKTLRAIQDMVEAELGVTFNHVMLNKYEDGTIYIGKHADTKENKVIASVSLGAERTFIMTPNPKSRHSKGTTDVRAATRRWDMTNGSLFIMQGKTQENWKHEIPKQPKITAGRISLTFRQLVHD